VGLPIAPLRGAATETSPVAVGQRPTSPSRSNRYAPLLVLHSSKSDARAWRDYRNRTAEAKSTDYDHRAIKVLFLVTHQRLGKRLARPAMELCGTTVKKPCIGDADLEQLLLFRREEAVVQILFY